MMLSGAPGCSKVVNTMKAQQSLEEADRQIAGRDFDAALRSNEDALEAAPDMFGDRALYQMALTYVHPDNPCPNYRESDRTLQKLMLDFPGSALKDDAKVWRHVLREIGRRDLEIAKRRQKIEKMNETVAGLKKALQNKDLEIVQQEDRIKELQTEINDLKIKIERLKEVDLGIEEKKRKTLPQ